MELDSEHWQSRFKTEQILEVSCPKCGAAPHAWCDRTGDKLSKRGAALARAGTPPSHQERMWVRQGHAVHEFPGLLARQVPGWDECAARPGGTVAAMREPARGNCGACARERAIRAQLASAVFPVGFPCRHPGSGPVPQFPARYAGERPCPECGMLRTTEIVVQDPRTTGYRCSQGHMWLTRPVPRRPAPAGQVPGDDERPPWE